MDSQPSIVQAYCQEAVQKSGDKASTQASAQPPSPNQLLRGAARKCPRPSAYATTTPYTLPSTTIPSPSRDLIQERDKPSRSPIVESPPKLPSQEPPQENNPPSRQPVGRLAPKRDHTLQVHRALHQGPIRKKTLKLTRAVTQRDVQEPTQEFAGKVAHRLRKAPAQPTADTVTGQPPRRSGHVPCTTSSITGPNQQISQLPVRVTTKGFIQDPAGLTTRRPIRVISRNIVSRNPARALAQGNVRGSIGTPTPPLTTPSIDLPLAANQEVIVRVGQQSLSLGNIAGSLVLRVEDTWRLLEEIVSH